MRLTPQSHVPHRRAQKVVPYRPQTPSPRGDSTLSNCWLVVHSHLFGDWVTYYSISCYIHSTSITLSGGHSAAQVWFAIIAVMLKSLMYPLWVHHGWLAYIASWGSCGPSTELRLQTGGWSVTIKLPPSNIAIQSHCSGKLRPILEPKMTTKSGLNVLLTYSNGMLLQKETGQTLRKSEKLSRKRPLIAISSTTTAWHV